MIGARDRWVAMVGCLAAVTMAIGAKASGPALAIWTVTVLACVAIGRPNSQNSFSEWAKPSTPVLSLLSLATFAMISAFWAHNPVAAISAGAMLAAVVVVGHLLHRGLDQLSPAASTLVSGWFMIGLVGGSLILLSEYLTSFALTRWVLTTVPSFRPLRNMMFAQSNGQWILLDRSAGNWSVAAVNFMVWPCILALSVITRDRARLLLPLALFALVAVITSISDHQTSQVGLIASLLIFGAANWAPFAVRSTAFALSILLIIAVVPLSYGANRIAHLQEAPWAQFTLKERLKIWGNVAENYLKAPLLGIGAGNTTIAQTFNAAPPSIDQQIVPKHHPHNMLLQIWLELGAVGALLLSLVVVSVFRALDRLPLRVVPYVLATGASLTVQVSATWSLWSSWFLCAVAMTISFLFLGVRLAREAELPRAQKFSEIWLPQTLMEKLRSRTTA